MGVGGHALWFRGHRLEERGPEGCSSEGPWTVREGPRSSRDSYRGRGGQT